MSIDSVISIIFLEKNLWSHALNPGQLGPLASMLTTVLCCLLPNPYDCLWSYLREHASADPKIVLVWKKWMKKNKNQPRSKTGLKLASTRLQKEGLIVESKSLKWIFCLFSRCRRLHRRLGAKLGSEEIDRRCKVLFKSATWKFHFVQFLWINEFSSWDK